MRNEISMSFRFAEFSNDRFFEPPALDGGATRAEFAAMQGGFECAKLEPRGSSSGSGECIHVSRPSISSLLDWGKP